MTDRPTLTDARLAYADALRAVAAAADAHATALQRVADLSASVTPDHLKHSASHVEFVLFILDKARRIRSEADEHRSAAIIAETFGE